MMLLLWLDGEADCRLPKLVLELLLLLVLVLIFVGISKGELDAVAWVILAFSERETVSLCDKCSSYILKWVAMCRKRC